VNLPVLDDDERARIGTLYTASAFEARRLGAALVARNIAAMLDGALAAKPRDWKPLVYCWRGGQRSRALAHVLNEVGWRAMQLDGGYRAYRRHVVGQLETLPSRFRFVVLAGSPARAKTGSLLPLRRRAQTLDPGNRASPRLAAGRISRRRSAFAKSIRNLHRGRWVHSILRGWSLSNPSKRIGRLQLRRC
jgi:tRNA 2-selenouridine synthase